MMSVMAANFFVSNFFRILSILPLDDLGAKVVWNLRRILALTDDPIF